VSSNAKIIKHKVGLLNLTKELNNISDIFRLMGVSKETFYTYKEAYDEGEIEAVLDKSRRKPNFKNRIESPIEEAVISYAMNFPAHKQRCASNELRKQGVLVSGTGIRCIWL
jgi:Winged helix-turn helix